MLLGYLNRFSEGRDQLASSRLQIIRRIAVVVAKQALGDVEAVLCWSYLHREMVWVEGHKHLVALSCLQPKRVAFDFDGHVLTDELAFLSIQVHLESRAIGCSKLGHCNLPPFFHCKVCKDRGTAALVELQSHALESSRTVSTVLRPRNCTRNESRHRSGSADHQIHLQPRGAAAIPVLD